jgi:hypothetical protein
VGLSAGEQDVCIDFGVPSTARQYLFICLCRNERVSVRTSTHLHTGMMLLRNRFNRDVAVSGTQSPPPGIGIDTFDFWLPNRRPDPQQLGFRLNRALQAFHPEHLTSGTFRPTRGANAWVADPEDDRPFVRLQWSAPVRVSSLVLHFDADWDHPLESTLRVHPERVVPLLVRSFRVEDGEGGLLYAMEGNHQSMHRVVFSAPVTLQALTCHVDHPSDKVPAAVFGIQVF